MGFEEDEGFWLVSLAFFGAGGDLLDLILHDVLMIIFNFLNFYFFQFFN